MSIDIRTFSEHSEDSYIEVSRDKRHSQMRSFASSLFLLVSLVTPTFTAGECIDGVNNLIFIVQDQDGLPSWILQSLFFQVAIIDINIRT